MSPQHRSHVPKFGSWDLGKDDVRYSAYFDNARQQKAGVRINPNDPEENPGAFMPGPAGDVEKIFNSVQAISSTKRQHSQVSGGGAHRTSHSYQPKAGYANGLSLSMQKGVRYPRERHASNPCDHLKQSRAPKHGDGDGNGSIPHASRSGKSAQRDKTSRRMIPNDPEKSPGALSGTAGTCSFFRSSSTKSSSSGKQHMARSAGSHRRSFSDELMRKSFAAKNGFSPSVLRSSGPLSGRSNRGQPVDNHFGVTLVPVFGDWDETDPNSGEGYTERFSRIKEEKENDSSNFQPMLSIPISHSDSPTKQRLLSYLFKKYRHVFSCGKQ